MWRTSENRENLDICITEKKADHNPRWYVAKTKPHNERQAAKILESRNLGVYLPLLRRRKRDEPLFPGYLFLKMDVHTEEYLRGRSAPGVSYILGGEREPLAVPEAHVAAICQRIERENAILPAERFKFGEHVVIASGPFRDIEAIFDHMLSPRGRCLVLFEVLGRLTRAQVDMDDLSQRVCHAL